VYALHKSRGGVMQPYISLDTLKLISERPVNEIFNLFVVVAKAVFLIAPITMVIIQLVKIPLLRFYHEKKLKAWLSGYSYPILPTTYLSVPAFNKRRKDRYGVESMRNKEELLPTLIRLSTAGNTYALFQLSIEQLCGQLLAAVQTVFNDPQNHRGLLIALASPQKEDSLNSDIDVLTPSGDSNKTSKNKKNKQQEQVYLAARSRVHSAIQRNIDSLQISGAIEWRAWLKFVSALVSAVIAIILINVSGVSDQLFLKFMFVIVVAPVAGYVASVLRDIIAVVEKLRN
jgi:hypothetical protein